MELLARHHIAPQTGQGFLLERGQLLKVIDPEGEQVSDLMAFARPDTGEWLSSGRSLDYNNTIYLTSGHTLYSNRSRAMFTIVEDTVGRHDFLLTPCSLEMFHILYKVEGHHPSCYENLERGLAPFGIRGDQISTTFNIFMNVNIGPSGTLSVDPPTSRADDHILLRAEMDMYAALTACSAGMSNNYRYKPIDFEIYRAAK